MNTAQFLAADPKVSAWVAASAGTGKTKVLTDRILNLLLQGFAPERILCLTFTKAAAAEMANRLTQRLARWATLSAFDLTLELKDLLGKDSIPLTFLLQARQLFTSVLDAPGGMKIQTIHGFCQSVLSRFPLEAGIPPHFRILDEALGEDILAQAQRKVFTNPTPLVGASLSILNPYMADQGFSLILNGFYQNRSRVMAILTNYETFWDYVKELLNFLEIDSFVKKPEEILDPDLVTQLKSNFMPTEGDYESYIHVYLTQKQEIRKKLYPDQLMEAERVFRFVRSLSALEIAQKTVAALALFKEILTEYQDLKIRRCVLDYDDLIQQTHKLLIQPGIAAWVLYKLDGGIDHLLIDEAQDTNAAQWNIILSLTAEFFTQDKPFRTLFAVGDAKQSIYSFQGANPEDFLKLKMHFATLSQKVGQNWRDVKLDLSYRSTAAILAIVDEVFASDQNKKGISFEETEIIHQVHREHSDNHLPGLVELWPLISYEAEEEEALEGEWHLPLKRVERSSPQYRLAQFLADQVSDWIASKGILPSTNEPIQPRDILILVRKRSILSKEIIRAFKKRDIPVAGADRLVLTDHIAIMDLLALGQFVLLPEDDLTLASVLRSPLIGMSEEDLFTLAYQREGTLWASLSRKIHEAPFFETTHKWLTSCLRKADLCPVYEFYNWVLTQGEGRRRFLSRLGHEVEDALNEFLTQSLNYDLDHASSLQGFVHFMNQQNQEIKRDVSDTLHNQIRLMTVHGSKGLQAPIVILPEAAEPGKDKWDPLLWGSNIVMLRPTQSQDTDRTRYLKEKAAEQTIEEKRRLLYVALTRAQDRLYVGGWASSKELAPDCWYRVLQEALERKNGTHRYCQEDNINKGDMSQSNNVEVLFQKPIQLPEWAVRPPTEIVQIKSQTHEKKISSTTAIERGIMIHRFFEFLPQLERERRHLAAYQMIKREGLSQSDWEKDIESTLQILDDPQFRDLFGPTSLAEVPIVGMVDGVLFQGRIDRLLVTSDTLTIVDYKSNKNPPLNTHDIPQIYLTQLEGYETALRSLYPNHRVRKILLWTSGPTIQVVA